MDWANELKNNPVMAGGKYGVSVGKTAGAVSALTALSMNDAQALTCICRSGVSLNEKDNEGNSVLHLAVESGNEDLVEIIVKHYEDEPTYLDEPNAAGQSAVFVAARLGDERIMQRLMQAHCDPTRRDKTGFTSLHVACLFGHFEIAKLLISRGCDAFTYDSMHQSPASIVEHGWDRCAGEIKRLQQLSKEMRTELLNKGMVAQPAFQEWFLRKHAETLRRYFNRRACELGMALHHSNVEIPLEEMEAEDDDYGDEDDDDDGGTTAGKTDVSSTLASTVEADSAAASGDDLALEKKSGGDGSGSDSDSDSSDGSEKDGSQAGSAPGSSRLNTGAETPPDTPAHPRREPTAKEYFQYVATRKLTKAQELLQSKNTFDVATVLDSNAGGEVDEHEIHQDGKAPYILKVVHCTDEKF
jgi:hypothetical protein